MKKGDSNMGAGFFFGFMAAAIIFATIMGRNSKSWRTECIDRGVAEYNPTTGRWQWIEGGAK